MTEAERQKAKRLRRVIAAGDKLSDKLAAWLALYEKGIAMGAKSMAEVEVAQSGGTASAVPPGSSPTPGPGALPPLSVDLPGEVVKPGKSPDASKQTITKPGEKKVAPRDPQTGHVIATPIGTSAAQLLEKYITDQNKWLKENGGTPYPEQLIAISCFSMQQCVDYYVSPFMSGEMALHALNAGTPIVWVWWFKRKRQTGLDTAMAEAETGVKNIPEKAPDKPKAAPIPQESDVLPKTYKEMEAATHAIMGGKKNGGL